MPGLSWLAAGLRAFRNRKADGGSVPPPPAAVRGYRITEAGAVPLEGLPLPGELPSLPGTLFVEAGLYRVEDSGFALNQPGVYRFYRLGGATVQRVVCPPDPEQLLRHVGWLWSYGSADEEEAPDSDLPALGRAPRFLGCSRLAFLAVRLFAEAGIAARVAGLFTAEARNGHDDGHTVAEVLIPGTGWVVYDPSFQGCPTIEGRRCSAFALVSAVRGGASVGWRGLPGNPPLAPFRHSGCDYGPWVAERALSTDALTAWYRRLAGTALIWEYDRFFASAEQVAADALPSMAAARYHLVQQQQFLDLFYPTAEETRSFPRSPSP